MVRDWYATKRLSGFADVGMGGHMYGREEIELKNITVKATHLHHSPDIAQILPSLATNARTPTSSNSRIKMFYGLRIPRHGGLYLNFELRAVGVTRKRDTQSYHHPIAVGSRRVDSLRHRPSEATHHVHVVYEFAPR
jgi:hypothetical protein